MGISAIVNVEIPIADEVKTLQISYWQKAPIPLIIKLWEGKDEPNEEKSVNS
jgi:hypothetical protein